MRENADQDNSEYGHFLHSVVQEAKCKYQNNSRLKYEAINTNVLVTIASWLKLR